MAAGSVPGVHLRVLMFIPHFFPHVGGAERQADLLAATLLSRGIVVEFLTPQLEPDWPLEDRTPSGVMIHRIPYSDLNRRFPHIRNLGLGLTTMILAMVRTFRAIRRLASRFDVLHAHNAQVLETAWAVRSARTSGLATLVKVSSTGDWFDLAILGRLSRRRRPWLRWLVEGTDRWVAISRAVVANLRQFGIPADRIVYLPNGVRLPATATKIPGVATHFLHLGRISSTAPRDIDGLVRTFELVAQRHQKAELALVGGGDRLAHLRASTAASPVAARLAVPGHQDPSPWLDWAHCMVQPSFVEGMSNTLLEAMAAGIACVAYDIPPNREVLGDGAAGILVPVADYHELAEALSHVASVDGAARMWGRRGRERAESTYGIEEIATRTISLYEGLLGRAQMNPHHPISRTF